MTKFRLRRRKKLEPRNEDKGPFIKNKAVTGEKTLDSNSFFHVNPVMAKLKIGNSNDSAERQADTVADKVVKSQNGVQKSQEEEIQSKVMCQKEDEEPAQTKLQKQEMEEEEIQAKFDLRKQEEEEEAIQTKVQRQEEEETVSAKINVQKKSGPRELSVSFEDKLKSARSGGVPLPEDIRKEMEQKLKKDFSKVRVHTDEGSTALCSEISAQAFTSGHHIFFNKGKFQPASSTGKHLLAHELTHVLQQKEG